MPEIKGIEKLFSLIPRKKFGRFRRLGTFQLGSSSLGVDDVYIPMVELGIFYLGQSKLGNLLMLSGIYRTDNVSGKTKYYREPYYITKNPRTEPQQLNRQKFAGAVLAWQGLTEEQQNQYNQRARGKRFSGYNLFLREYLQSN